MVRLLRSRGVSYARGIARTHLHLFIAIPRPTRSTASENRPPLPREVNLCFRAREPVRKVIKRQ